jgi:hypothetical protein
LRVGHINTGVADLVFTTVLGSIPLLTDPFFGAMAVCIIFGLMFAAVLSLIVTPVAYAIFFNVREGTTPPEVNPVAPAADDPGAVPEKNEKGTDVPHGV